MNDFIDAVLARPSFKRYVVTLSGAEYADFMPALYGKVGDRLHIGSLNVTVYSISHDDVWYDVRFDVAE